MRILFTLVVCCLLTFGLVGCKDNKGCKDGKCHKPCTSCVCKDGKCDPKCHCHGECGSCKDCKCEKHDHKK